MGGEFSASAPLPATPARSWLSPFPALADSRRISSTFLPGWQIRLQHEEIHAIDYRCLIDYSDALKLGLSTFPRRISRKTLCLSRLLAIMNMQS